MPLAKHPPFIWQKYGGKKKMAKEVGISYNFLENIFRGDRNMSPETAFKIAAYMKRHSIPYTVRDLLSLPPGKGLAEDIEEKVEMFRNKRRDARARRKPRRTREQIMAERAAMAAKDAESK